MEKLVQMFALIVHIFLPLFIFNREHCFILFYILTKHYFSLKNKSTRAQYEQNKNGFANYYFFQKLSVLNIDFADIATI